ncbi:MAG TPA: amidase [Dehalococcoidia bacterium]|nr:amidase [Dehalococcoidia bacterium]
MSDLTRITIAEAAPLIRDRRLSPVELTDACLARIEAVEPRLNAFITVTAEAARAAAKEAADEIARGGYRGDLHGIPVALKDLFATAGIRTTAGSTILADNVPESDSDPAARLRAAGAVLVGKLNLHEFAFGATGVNPHYGPCRNPWDTSRITGGSSSGSGASVASGECLAALGTDTGGSIRIPASLCGVTGIKPTFGRVSRRGVIPLSWSLDHVGPLTRCVEDAAIVLQTIAGYDPDDASSSTEPVSDYTVGLRDGVGGLRVGVPGEFFFDNVDPEVEAAVRAAIGVLEGQGASVSEVSLPLVAEAPAAVTAIMLPEALAYHRKWMDERPDDYGEDVRYRLELGATFLAVHHVQAQRFREMIAGRWRDEVFSKVDLLAMPATMAPAFPIERSDLSVTFSLIRNTNPLNLLGVPAISVPCGFTASGLPIGLQLAGRWWDESTVLRAAFAYEQATDWHKRAPPV